MRSRKSDAVATLVLVGTLALAGCDGEGKIIVINETGGALSVTVDGKAYTGIEDEDSIEHKVEVGGLLGAGTEKVRVTGSGTCRFGFDFVVNIEDDVTEEIVLDGDMGTIRIRNETAGDIRVQDSYENEGAWTDISVEYSDGTSEYLLAGTWVTLRRAPGSWNVQLIDRDTGRWCRHLDFTLFACDEAEIVQNDWDCSGAENPGDCSCGDP